MKKLFIILFIGTIGWTILGIPACKQAYTPPAITNPGTYLVIEGFINNGPDSTYFDLTHTFTLSDTAQTTPELNAKVSIQGTDNSSYPLGETGNGFYGAPISGLNPAIQYRLFIQTSAGKQYASSYVTLKASPAIDSVNWTLNSGGTVQLYVNTHDPQNNTRYYRWNYQETYEYQSAYLANLQWVNDSIEYLFPDTFYTCWRQDVSTSILLATSAQLGQDLIYEYPLVSYPATSINLSVEYSILVTQYPLTQDAFSWWQVMQKNTEQIGSIFGVQPTINTGNIRCLSDSNETVVGYVSGGTIAKQRIFIAHTQLYPWIYNPDCGERNVPQDSIGDYIKQGMMLVSTASEPGLYTMSGAICVDCLLLGGTNVKPSFMP